MRNRPDLVAAEVLGGLGHDRLLLAPEGEVDLEGEEHLGHAVGWELDVDHRPRHLDDPSYRMALQPLRCSFRSLMRSSAPPGFGPADDLGNLGGDLGLPGPVGRHGQRPDQVVGVVGCRLHCPPASRVLGGGGFEQHVEHDRLDISGQEAIEDLLR